ncbi:hypothetical protein MSAN_01591500 [Mycena sanguinolenta]|uniref:F-box domain-containing protein n=1 Tax=Mycena sanguinolenta TaxID=230812 RepID=A0A8H6Y4M0_9AGAR|nr:hypothetical protein MSAN_01591500 [Mycena sanguinolenta]
MLLDLSIELLEAIGAQLARSDQAVLGSVCKTLNGAVEPLLFSDLVLKTSLNGLSDKSLQKVKALATGATRWFLHAKTLHISPVRMTTGRTTHDEKLVNIFQAALAALSKIRAVAAEGSYGYVHFHPYAFWTWGQTSFLGFLNKLTTLDNLELQIPSTLDLSGLQVRSLRKLTLKNCEPLRIAGGTLPPPPPWPAYQMSADLILAQNRLHTLHVEGPAEWTAIWRIFQSRTQWTKPVQITTNVVTSELFDYLSSCSVLEELTLLSPDGGDQDASNRLADAFFETVLPRFVECLTRLSCPAPYESRFSFGAHNINVISSLYNLTELEVSINAGVVRRKEITVPIERQGERYPGEAEQADIDVVVMPLLRTAATLPALHTLIIRATEPEDLRLYYGMVRGDKIDHLGAVNAAIVNAVENFHTNVPCAAVVCAGESAYQVREVAGSMEEGQLQKEWGYKRVASWNSEPWASADWDYVSLYF